MKRSLLLIALALTTTSLTACASGESASSKVRAAPSSKFLFTAANEFKDGTNGPACQAIASDWIAQNMGVK